MPYVVCPKCNAESYFSLSAYKGPFRCMKCRETFNITIENSEVKSYEGLSKEEQDKLLIRKHYQ
jgi:transposase-like protein